MDDAAHFDDGQGNFEHDVVAKLVFFSVLGLPIF